MKRVPEVVIAYLRAPFAPEHRFVSGLLIFVLLRLLMVFFLVLDVPPLEGHVPPWYFHTGGDQDQYYRLALALADGQTANEKIGIGVPLEMLPFVWLVEPGWYRDIVAPLLILHGFIFAGASVALVGLIGRDYTGDKRVGMLGAALWSLLPVPVYLVLELHPAATLLRGSVLPKIMWLTGISDGPSSFGILVGVWALGRAFGRDSLRAFFVAGLALGWAVMVRIAVAPMVALLLGVLLLARAWRGVLWVGVGGLLGYLPQAVFNTVQYGFPLYTGYLRTFDPGNPRRPLAQILTELPYSPGAAVQSLTYFTGRYPFFVPLLLLAGALLLLLVVTLWRRRGWPYAAILLGVPVGNIVTNLAIYFFPADPIRFTMLSYPYLMVLGAYLAFLAWDALLASLARRARPGRLSSTSPRASDS